ncbi:MAG: PorT family protein [Bacteroidales bacterium]|nr:PorT family protein [Bacteroidales bacterium]
MMKFLGLLLVCSVSLLAAQDFQAFIKGGIIASQVHGDQLSGFNKMGLTGGLGVEYPFPKFNARLEILFSQKGSRKNPTNEDPTKYLMRLNYVEVPLLICKFFNSTIGVELGTSSGILLKTDNVEWDINGQIVARQPFRRFEWAGHVGLIYMINEHSQIHMRYSNSILPIRPYPSGTSSYYFYDRGQYNIVIYFTYEHYFKRKK